MKISVNSTHEPITEPIIASIVLSEMPLLLPFGCDGISEVVVVVVVKYVVGLVSSFTCKLLSSAGLLLRSRTIKVPLFKAAVTLNAVICARIEFLNVTVRRIVMTV